MSIERETNHFLCTDLPVTLNVPEDESTDG